MGNVISQLYPPKPVFTEHNLDSLDGKVYIVTGSNTGVGKALAQILYSKHAKVYIAARSPEKSQTAIEAIKSAVPDSKGTLNFLHLDLSDLKAVKSAAETFLAQESRLDVLFNNAGVAQPGSGSKSAQGHELQMGTNCLGHFLFTKLLTPLLTQTAKSSPPNSVRVIWTSSSTADMFSPKNGVPMHNISNLPSYADFRLYSISKTGNYYHATEFARQHKDCGIVSVSLNPGNLDSELGRNANQIAFWVIRKTLLHPPVMGAYTELFAGLSPEVSAEKVGASGWIIPWGRIGTIRKDLVEGSKPKGEEGGTGVAKEFWEWSERQCEEFV